MLNRQPLDFSIKTKVFEGPLELLLDLVERRKLLINDISLAEVTDEYMRQVALMEELSLPNTANFITLAATLLLVKSKSLLPILDLTEEEEQSIEDLEERLKRYQIFRNAAVGLQQQFGTNRLYAAQFHPPKDPLFVVDSYCQTAELHATMLSILNDLPQKPKTDQATIKVVISLEDMMHRLEQRIRQQLKVRFSDLHAGETEKKVIIVGFLAVLELFKQGNLIVHQGGRFDDIEIELETADTPQYY